MACNLLSTIHVDAYAMVGIDADSGYQRSDNQRLGKRRSATITVSQNQ